MVANTDSVADEKQVAMDEIESFTNYVRAVHMIQLPESTTPQGRRVRERILHALKVISMAPPALRELHG